MESQTKFLGVLLAAISLFCSAEPVKNIIFLVGDGMGFQQVEAARFYSGTSLVFESFPYAAQQTTYPEPADVVTDSAAAATALSTGVKVNNGVISLRIPGNSSRLDSILEYVQRRGWRTGLVTTKTMTDATPAAFGAHAVSRYDSAVIAFEYLNSSRPNVLLGGGGSGMSVATAEAAGYTVVTSRAELLALDFASEEFVSGQFGIGNFPYEADGIGDRPHLSEMTAVALDLLDDDPDGFFLMAEGGLIDSACHANHLPRMMGEMMEFNQTVAVVTNWAAGRTDTLILVTADHETGGLSVLADNGTGALPTVSWATTGHTSSNVPVFVSGNLGGYSDGMIDNTRHFELLTEAILVPASDVMVQAGRLPVSVGGSVVSGAVYRLESCDSLVAGQWTPVAVSTADAPEIVLSDTNSPAPGSRFFRMISLP